MSTTKNVIEESTWIEKGSNADKNLGSKAVVRSRVTLHTRDNGFSVQQSTYFMGVNQKSGKRWGRWKTNHIISFRRGVRGQIVPIEKTSKGGFYGGVVAYNSMTYYARSRWKEKYDSIVKLMEQYRVTAPLCGGELSIDTLNNSIPNGMFDLVQREPRDFVDTVFGKSRYRKDLMKAVANRGATGLGHIAIAGGLRGLVPTDWLIEFINSTEQVLVGWDSTASPFEFREIAKRLDQRSLRRLLRSGFNSYAFNDMVVGAKRYGYPEQFPRISTWNELHDAFYENHGMRRRLLSPKQNIKLGNHEWSKKVHEAFAGSKYTHVIPKDSNDLIAWSNQMNNCIRGYDTYMKQGRKIVGGIYLGDQLIANYEVNPHLDRLSQLLGKYNQGVKDPYYSELVDLFSKAGLETSAFWGKQGLDMEVVPG